MLDEFKDGSKARAMVLNVCSKYSQLFLATLRGKVFFQLHISY